MNTHRFIFLALLVWTPCALAGDSAKPALPEKAAPALDLKTKSSFSVQPGTRNPFLPIGWKGTPVVTQVAAPKAMTSADAFRVTSILIGSPSLAVINGKTYEEGQMIRMGKPDPRSKTPQVRAKVYRILDGSVQIQVEDQMLTIQMNRGQLKDIQPDQLLNTDPE